MGQLVSYFVGEARSLLNDGYANNFAQDDVSDLCTGSVAIIRAYNQNIQNMAGGAPADPISRVNGVPSALASFVAATGIMTLASAPAAGSQTYLEYFFNLMTDAEYIGFCQAAARFIGLVPTFKLLTDNTLIDGPLAEAMVHYMAYLGASKMTNLTSWYYRANAGNKSFDKAVIAQAFKDTAKEEYATAVEVRNDTYTREGQRNAPSWGVAVTPVRNWTPPR